MTIIELFEYYTYVDYLNVKKRGETIMARKFSKQERKEMARKAMEKRGNKKPSGSGFAKLDADAKKLSE